VRAFFKGGKLGLDGAAFRFSVGGTSLGPAFWLFGCSADCVLSGGFDLGSI